MEIDEAEAYRVAQARAGERLARVPEAYRWGWVFRPEAPGYGSGPLAVLRNGEVRIYGSSQPWVFTDASPPRAPSYRGDLVEWLKRLFR